MSAAYQPLAQREAKVLEDSILTNAARCSNDSKAQKADFANLRERHQRNSLSPIDEHVVVWPGELAICRVHTKFLCATNNRFGIA